MKDVLGIKFDDNNYPDVGSIAVDKSGDLVLLADDIPKLNNVLTRSNIVGTYGVQFPYKSGDGAFVIDATRVFMYEAASDAWYELG